MANKKQQSKKEAPVLLGFTDGEIEVDNDAYITKLGGLPIWLDPKTPPSEKVCKCKICKDNMYLIFQSYVPLPESPYHRVLYVWACNKRSCMRKEGSFSVVRSHIVDPAYLKAHRQKEEEKRKKEEKKAAAAAAATSPGFQLGDLWGSNNSGSTFGSKPSTGSGFGMVKQPSSNAFGSQKTTASVVASGALFGAKKKAEEDTLAEKMNNMVIQDPIIDTNALPQFPGHYLYIDEEKMDNYDAMGIDMSRYKEYLDMEKDMLMEVDEGGETWQGEAYEKQHLPKGVDKQFKKFTERIECSPAQCVRYGFHSQPLFYGALNAQQQQLITSKCKHCHGPRVFEFQLMPNILSILPTAEYATSKMTCDLSGKAKNIDAKTVLDSWNVGMEFGTILVFVCQKDCHPGQMEDATHVEEALVVQYETD